MDTDSKGVLLVLSCLGALVFVVAMTFLGAFLLSLVWGLIVPLIFPVAIAQGLVPASLTILQAFKISILFSFLGMAGNSSVVSSSVDLEGCTGIIVKVLVSMLVWAILIAISGLLVFLLWAWIVPDVFSGAVELGVLPATLSYWHAVLLAVLFGFLGLGSHSSSSSSKKE